jgi:dihydrofolate reductase
MKTIIIVAMTKDRVIGRGGAIPWREPEDLKHFKRVTTGHALIMGRKTYESIGKPLPDRRNVVITRNESYSPQRPESRVPVDVVHSLDEAFALCRSRNEEKAFIIGGGQIYERALPLADELIVTCIDRDDVVGDTFFPEWNAADWTQAAETTAGQLRVVTYRRAK